MQHQILAFRVQVESYFGGRPRRGVRYCATLRTQAEELASAQLSRGDRLSEVAVALGVGVGTLRRWMEAAPPGSRRLRQVEVVEVTRELGEDGGREEALG